MKFSSVYGVDFSGAKQAGRTIWVARAKVLGRGSRGRLRLVDLSSLEALCGHCDREPALRCLVDLIAKSRDALWGMDFPFGLPIEILDDGHGWPEQLARLDAWTRGGAHDFGLWCVDRAKKRLGRMHVRRTTDLTAKAPFDCYHYRIVYQMFHGMRDVLGPLARTRGTAILPFQYRRLPTARRVVVEACPGSTLKRWSVAHQRYKQPAGGPLTPVRRRTRRAIVDALARHIAIEEVHRRVMMRDPGGDALDAVIAAAGAFQAWHASDHKAIARDPRHPREGYLYV